MYGADFRRSKVVKLEVKDFNPKIIPSKSAPVRAVRTGLLAWDKCQVSIKRLGIGQRG